MFILYVHLLMFAIVDLHVTGYEKVVKELIDNGADLNLRDNEGSTPLHYAADSGNSKGQLKQHCNPKRGNVILSEAESYLQSVREFHGRNRFH